MSQRVTVCGKANPMRGSRSESESEQGVQSHAVDPKPSELSMGSVKRGKTLWRREPTSVENGADDLWIGVKGQSNSVIAGSPRNAFRCSVVRSTMGVEH